MQLPSFWEFWLSYFWQVKKKFKLALDLAIARLRERLWSGERQERACLRSGVCMLEYSNMGKSRRDVGPRDPGGIWSENRGPRAEQGERLQWGRRRWQAALSPWAGTYYVGEAAQSDRCMVMTTVPGGTRGETHGGTEQCTQWTAVGGKSFGFRHPQERATGCS